MQLGDLGGKQATAAREAAQDQVEPGVGRTRPFALEVGQDGGQFTAGQNLRGVDADRGYEVHRVPFVN